MEVSLTLEDVYDLSINALKGCGCADVNAIPVAESIRDAEADGIRNVGLNYLSHYCEHLLCGKVDGNVAPEWKQIAPAVIAVDAKHGFAHGAFVAGMGEFVELVKQNAIGSLQIRNSYAAGVIGWYVEKLAEQGLVALAFANSPPAIAPWGGSEAFFGTNPLAFACPRNDSPPLIIDQSSSTTAKVNVVMAAHAGETIPDTWALDKFGNPTTDAKAGLEGSMAPSGGYKGVALAMIVDLFAGALAGPNMSYSAPSFGDNIGGTPSVGQFFIGISPERFNPNFIAKAENMFAAMCSQDGVRLPGDRRHAFRAKAAREGVHLPTATYQKLLAYCDKADT